MNDKGFNPLTASRDATSNVPRGVPSSSQDELVALGKTLSLDFQDWLRDQSVGWLADQDLRQEILGQISLLEAEIQPLLQINRELVELEQLLTAGFSTTNFEEGGEQSASASENQPSSGATALFSEELASHQDGINPVSEPKLKKEAESSPPSFHPQPESQLQVGGLKNLAQRLEFEQQQQKSSANPTDSAKTQAEIARAANFRQLSSTDVKFSPETGSDKPSPNPKSQIPNPKWDAPEIASPAQPLPEIPNSPSSQQLGETKNIPLPLSREGIINEYQSTPSRELSPPIDREEENPPSRNYSPTSKVSPTYVSSSILSANPTDSAKTKPLPEIPNSPSSQQLGETKNIPLPLSREGIINEYQSTPNRELSPPIDRKEENPPPRNYSPTSKVSPTYVSSSILSANPTDSAKTKPLPEIPNSPTSQQLGETKNIPLPLSREGIINEYQSTPNKELSPPINREEENPPSRNYSPTSKVSPTYVSSSILSANPTDSAKTKPLPEIPNSPSSQQLGETKNIPLPLSREGIINEYQSTPNRELSPPIDREEENPPSRNYSPTSKVSPTYVSSSILSANPTDSAKTKPLPEIPNSPSSQQLGETKNIPLPLSREGIINEYQSTPNKELSPPIDREEENPPSRNYSPTSKVSPTYVSSSILSANPTDSAKTKPLPEIPNSPSSQQLGETKNIPLPLSREGIINEYQSTPNRELSPPIDRKEENPPSRNYSPTSKVSPTYVSSSILSANPTDSAKTKPLPEIPNSPSSQQLGETKNIPLPLSREGIINEYQSTPNRELSPPIDREEENTPSRNYSPTSKVSPTYVSSSILSANSTDSAKTKPLPEIPNSPSSQQLGETKNIPLPLSREGIINEYQSTPNRELSPPIDRKEENPPSRNYSPTSKVSPTYVSSSILSANPTDSAKTKPLPEIPNSPSSQQLGETKNIPLPLSREGIINEYQSTPNKELSPPIDREEENPPSRNYSPTSKVSPTYVSSSLLLADSLPVETVFPQEKEKKSDFDIGVINEELPQMLVREWLPSSLTVEPINDSPTGNSINKSKSSDLSTTQEDNFSDRQGTFSNLDQENRREIKNPLTRVSQQNSRIFSLKNTAKFSHKYARSKSPSPNFDTTEQPQILKKIEEKSQAISQSIPQQSHLSEAEIDLIIEAIAQEIQQQYRQFYGS